MTNSRTNATVLNTVDSERYLKLQTAKLDHGFYNIIDGERSVSGGRLAVIDPATGQSLATVPDIDRDGLERAISAARGAFPAWSSTPYSARKAVIVEIVHVIEQHMGELSALLTSEHGHPAAGAKWEIEWLTKSYGPALYQMDLPNEENEMEQVGHVVKRYLPLGVVCAISPWNLPVLLSFVKVLPALLTGNTVVLKPSPLAEDNEGNLWIGTDTSLVRWKPGFTHVWELPGLRSNQGMDGVTSLAAPPQGSLWLAVAGTGPGLGLQRLVSGVPKSFRIPGFDGSTVDVETLLLDRSSALWIGTYDQGIYRIHGDDVDHFASADGLSGDRVYHFCEDREGNIWVATSGGVDNFRDLPVATFSKREGLGSEVDGVLAARDGTLWVATSGALVALRQDRASVIDVRESGRPRQVTSIFEDHAGRLWVGADNSLLIYQDGRFTGIDSRDGKPIGMAYGLAEDMNRNMFVLAQRPPMALLRIRDRRAEEELDLSKSLQARRVAADPSGGLWLGLVNGDLAQYRNGRTETFHFSHRISSSVDQVTVNPDGTVLGATAFGLIGWKSGRQQVLTARNGLPCDGVYAFVSDNQGDIWLYMNCGLVEISKEDLQRWWEHPETTVQYKLFDVLDGALPGSVPFNGAARTTDGRLWFANGLELQMINPAHLIENSILPPVHIEEVIADRKAYSPDGDVHLPALTRNLEIGYTALSFAVPKRVRFRYKLDGRDAEWQEPNTRRQAFYTDLGPGRYRFRVIACNNDGLWNEVGATLNFSIAPAWYQTIWFQSLSAALSLFLLWSLYRFRVRQIAATLSSRFDERLAERTRLARELHDTFLQTVQGSKMVADDALDVGADETRMRAALEKLSGWLGQAVEEGRAALHSLRVSTIEKNHLSEALQRATENHQIPSSMTVAFCVIGDARDVHPIVRDEVYRIGYEAIRNAAAHSRASRLEIDLRYASDLSLRIKDNGLGIDPAFSDQGRPGHFGLQGMRERAAGIHSKLTIVSSANAGTEVTLVVPGDVVYRNVHPSFVKRLKEAMRRLFGSSKVNGV